MKILATLDKFNDWRDAVQDLIDGKNHYMQCATSCEIETMTIVTSLIELAMSYVAILVNSRI